MGKYDPLRRFLRRRRDDSVILTFAEIELIIGGFLPHAANDPAWWRNEPAAGRRFVQCSAWLDAGFETVSADPAQGVCFRRRLPLSAAKTGTG